MGWLAWVLLLNFFDKIFIFCISLMSNLSMGSLLGTIEGLEMMPSLNAWIGSLFLAFAIVSLFLSLLKFLIGEVLTIGLLSSQQVMLLSRRSLPLSSS